MEPKPWYASKINWLGIALLLLAAAQQATTDDLVPDSWDKWILAGAGALIMILRSVTAAPIANRVL